MAERYDFYVHDNRKVTFNLTEPIMREDSGVTDFVFHIPKILNELEVSDWQWWLVFVNAKKEKYSIALTLSDDPESPLEKNVATYTVDYAMSIKAGSVQFALEAINAGTGGAIDNEWHTLTYETKVKETLQGNQAEYAETESDVISALLIEVRNKVNQLVGGATPAPVSAVSQMTDTSKLYLLTTDGKWYYYNGSAWVSGGVYGAGVTDAVPTQGSTNAVSSGGVYEAIPTIDATLTHSGQAADAKKTGDEITSLKDELNESKNGKMFINGSFSYGIFNSSNFPESDPRKFNAVMMMAEKYDRDITITAKTGYNFLAYWYNDSDAYVGKSANWGTSKTIPANTSFRLWVRQTPLDTSVILDLVAVKESIVFNSEINDRVEKNANDIAIEKANIYAIADGHVFLDTKFIYGKMNTTTGAVVPDTTKYQVVMSDFITADKDLTLNCNSGYRYQVWWYTDQDVYISRTGSFKTAGEKYTVSAGTNFRLFVTLDPPNIQATVPIDTFAKNVFIATEAQNQVANIRTKPLTVLPDYILNSLSYRSVGVLSKGYILLSCDDGTAGLASYTIPMLISKNVPATFGLLMTSPVITDESYLATVIDAVENHGCCVAQHGSTQWTTYAEDALNKYFDDTETLFAQKGITEIHGAICPGGSASDTNALVQAVAGGRFGAVFSGGLQGEIKYGNYNAVGARTNMYAMARYSAIGFTQQTYQQAIDDAYDNHYVLCPFWHDYSVVNDTAKQAIIEGMIDYAKTKGLTFITMADLPTII